ncbi:MAG: hypothetical protein BGO01_12675 [Armatimonadetes bacterium 55-13]|nr:response regulator [Armatimonadota bacterium]OJU61766.1 MAG: hypothetical protein BGO01_12675 [Armatimonadetes bacterium 55-13]
MRKILFVDDEIRILDGFRRMVRSKRDEWDCSFAASADEAWTLIQEIRPDAIVSDLNMPGKSGIDLLGMVRGQEAFRFLPFLMLTGNNDLQQRVACLEAGASDFLNKPCDFVELYTRLTNAMALKSFQDQVREQNEILEIKVRERTLELERSRREVILRLAIAAEMRDSNTGAHILRVGLISRLLAEEMGYDSDFQENIFLASTMHDVGKIGISDTILMKPGALTPEERSEMQRHCELGAQLLRSKLTDIFKYFEEETNELNYNSLLELSAKIALTHHERWDGTGYPNGLAGDQIPIEGCIVSVADVYDALRSSRPYKSALSPEVAMAMMQKDSGAHFSVQVIQALVRRHAEVEAIIERHRAMDDEELPLAA